MPDFKENIRFISLELFDPAFPVPPEDEEPTKRRFMTLFEHEAYGRRGGNSTVSRVTNLYGETFALKRLHVANADGAGDADGSASGRAPSGTPSRKVLRNNLQSVSDSARAGASISGAAIGAEAARVGIGVGGNGTGVSATPDYVTQGHVAALYEEYRVHATVSVLRGYPKLYGFGLMDGDPVIVMEWVEGVLLRDCMRGSLGAPMPSEGEGLSASTQRETQCDGQERPGTPQGDIGKTPPTHSQANSGDASVKAATRLRAHLDTATGKAGSMPLQRVADLGIAVLALLERTFELDESFVHRDLSPRNIMLRTDRASVQQQLSTGAFDVCLIDFGSSTLVDGGDPSFTLNKNIWRMGTPSYAPPEMLSADIALPESWRQSETIDTYALCSVLYELYSGSKPYRFTADASSGAESPYRAKTENPPEPLVPRDPDGGALANIIASGLSAQQADRPSVAELKAALENWKRLPAQRSIGSLRGAKPADAAFWQPGYARKARTRRSVIAAAIVAVAAAASGAIIAPKFAGNADALDPSRYPVADALYDGPPLFKAFDGEHPGWMLCAEDGTIACKPESSRECGALREGLVALYDDVSQRYGFITPASDGSGGYAWAILPAFSQVNDFSEGLAAAQDPHSGLWGYADAAGAWAIEPQFRQAASFSHGAAAVQANDAETLWGAVDPQGAWLAPPQFASLGSRSAAGYAVAEQVAGEGGQSVAAEGAKQVADESVELAEGSSAGEVAQQAATGASGQNASAQGRWGIVDPAGTWSCPPRFARLRSCANGPAAAYDAESGRWGFVAPDGSWAIDPVFRDARPFYPIDDESDAVLAAVQDARTQLWYFIDETGQPYQGMEPCFWKLGDLHDDLAPAQASPQDSVVTFDGADGPANVRGVGKRYGYVDATGSWHLKRLTTLVDTAIAPAAL